MANRDLSSAPTNLNPNDCEIANLNIVDFISEARVLGPTKRVLRNKIWSYKTLWCPIRESINQPINL